MSFRKSDRGAVAVEFAFIVPLLVMLLLVIVEFGARYQRGTDLNNAAFVAAKDATVNHDLAKATAAARDAGAPNSATISVSPDPSTCATGSNVTVTITSTEDSPTKAFGQTFTLTVTGVARCDY